MRECGNVDKKNQQKTKKKRAKPLGCVAENGSVGSSGRSRRGSARSTPFKANLKHQHSCLPHKDLGSKS